MSVRSGLLALLDHEPRYGYQLKSTFEAATGGAWALNVGQVYTTLDRLQRDGLVDMETVTVDEAEQKRYTLTASGREELAAWWDAVPDPDDPPPRDELQLKVLLALELGSEHAMGVITRQRTALTRILQERRRAGAATRRHRSRRSAVADVTGAREELAAQMVTDALVVRAEADLRWLDLCEARLQRSAADLADHESPGAPASSVQNTSQRSVQAGGQPDDR
jgi:DNA-binding PadR family transcriptional regulator